MRDEPKALAGDVCDICRRDTSLENTFVLDGMDKDLCRECADMANELAEQAVEFSKIVPEIVRVIQERLDDAERK
jgi:hypothetical protein